MKTVSLRVGLFLTLNNIPYQIEKIVSSRCYLNKLHNGEAICITKVELLSLLSGGKSKLTGNDEPDAKHEDVVDVDIFSLSEPDQKVVDYKLAYIQAARAALGEKPTLKYLDKVIHRVDTSGTQHAPSPSSLYRWWKKWVDSNNDPKALVNRRSGSRAPKKFNQKVINLFISVAREVYMTRQRLTKKDVYDSFSVRLNRYNLQNLDEELLILPSRAQFYRMFSLLDKYEVMVSREGKREADNHFDIVGAGPIVSRILERVEVDHTELDVFVIDETTRAPIGKPNLTLLLDYYSKQILGFELGFEPPSEISVMRALKNAILTKDYINRFDRVKHQWEVFGIPHTLICDNGMEFHSKNLKRISQELNMELQFCPKKHPHFKGAVERVLRTTNESVSHKLPGTTKGSISKRGDYDSQKEAVITLKQANSLIHEWIINIYQNTKHRSTLRTPKALWSEGLKVVEPLMPESLSKLRLFCTTKSGHFS